MTSLSSGTWVFHELKVHELCYAVALFKEWYNAQVFFFRNKWKVCIMELLFLLEILMR